MIYNKVAEAVVVYFSYTIYANKFSYSEPWIPGIPSVLRIACLNSSHSYVYHSKPDASSKQVYLIINLVRICIKFHTHVMACSSYPQW